MEEQTSDNIGSTAPSGDFSDCRPRDESEGGDHICGCLGSTDPRLATLERSETDAEGARTEGREAPVLAEGRFDYRKAREERIVRNTEKRILKELGEDSFESIKNKLRDHIEIQKELELQRDNGNKLNVYSAGFDDQFVDFVTHDVKMHQKEGENFSEALSKYKKNHPQFLRTTNKIKFNTTLDLENKPFTKSYHDKMNDFFRGKINKI